MFVEFSVKTEESRHIPPGDNETITISRFTVPMVLFLLLAFAISLKGINSDNVWFDELISIQHIGAFHETYDPMMTIDSLRRSSPDHVPLWHWITRAWAELAGWSQFSLRMVSSLAGTMMIAMMFGLGADVFGRRAGIMAAGFTASSGFMLWYFHELRPNALMMLLAVIHTWLYMRIVAQRRRGRHTWILFAATGIMLIYTHWLGAVLFAGLCLHLLVFVPNSRRKVDVLLAWGICALTFLPFALIPKSIGSRLQFESLELPKPQTLLSFANLFVNEIKLLWVPLILSLIYSIWYRRKPLIFHMLFIALVMSVALIVVEWIYKPIPSLHPRAFLILWIPCSLIFAISISSLPRWTILSFLIMLAFTVSGLHWTQSDLRVKIFLVCRT